MLGYRLAKSITVTSKWMPSLGSTTSPPRYFLSLITEVFCTPAVLVFSSSRVGISALRWRCS